MTQPEGAQQFLDLLHLVTASECAHPLTLYQLWLASKHPDWKPEAPGARKKAPQPTSRELAAPQQQRCARDLQGRLRGASAAQAVPRRAQQLPQAAGQEILQKQRQQSPSITAALEAGELPGVVRIVDSHGRCLAFRCPDDIKDVKDITAGCDFGAALLRAVTAPQARQGVGVPAPSGKRSLRAWGPCAAPVWAFGSHLRTYSAHVCALWGRAPRPPVWGGLPRLTSALRPRCMRAGQHGGCR